MRIMRRTIVTGLAFIVGIAATPVIAPAAGLAPIIRPHYAAIVMDAATREVLYANAADEIRYPASITKVMTLFLTFDALESGRLKLDDPVPISRHAAAQRPSKLGLAAGRSLSVREAIEVVAVKSANDIAVALAEKVGGSEAGFARMMTNKARMLGMRATHFSNASGLNDVANFTSARDLAILSASILAAHPDRYSYFGLRTASYGKQTFANHNPLLGKLAGVDGIKTGFTNDAGYTQATSAMRNGRRLIVVVMGEPSVAARSRDLTALIDAGFSVLERRTRGQFTTVAANLPAVDHPALRTVPGNSPGDEQGSSED